MLKCLLETFEPEKEVADEIADDEQRNVAEGQEVWEVATCGATSIVTARATCFIEDAGNNQQTEDILDR